ncbi:hypothetical protein BJI67_16375 (plasmid) [Acidihalobacter aeolianus]|uniref:HD/PDEase domain-containing protein n=1 Tax=Acidihalobacter aeolianus TaxID=2792603 RepID=A0A1D8KD02_9GAMM|nr:HD domain-containing protein [Acidihalobacter aeolianus]AOV18814.1 hypothetical protein BJI67_16375 [Acidihalobacter aeolianus]
MSHFESLLATDLRMAHVYAEQAHSGQRRRYTGEPYIVHPVAVAQALSAYCADLDMLRAALLHDTIEDTATTANDLHEAFGPTVTELVVGLTHDPRAGQGNRAARKALERERLHRASAKVQTIKVFDVLDNIRDIEAQDPRFAHIYLPEQRALIHTLDKIGRDLKQHALNSIGVPSEHNA